MAANKLLEDFDLHIWSEGDRYVAQVTRSPIGPSKRAELKWPFEETHRELRLQLENAILRGRLRGSRGAVSADEKILRDFGSSMFKAVFREAEPIARSFNGSVDFIDTQMEKFEGLRVKLNVEPPELALLPWEYVFDEASSDPTRTFLSLSSRSPLVRFLDLNAPTYAAIDAPLNILGMIANPGGEWEPLDAEAERRGIEKAIDAMKDKDLVNFRWVQGETAEDLLSAMQQDDWHVFHFIGHGGLEVFKDSDGTRRSEGYVVFADGLGGAVKISPTQLATILQTGGHLRLAVLNCCDSGRGASPGEALVRSGLSASVAMQFPVSNDAAVKFASHFYGALVAGQTVERALTVGRVAMQITNAVEWGIPVLFTRAGANLSFNVKREPPRPAERAAKPVPPEPKAEHAARRQSAQAELRRLFAGVGI
ncbi:CHAT domain-containing protein [Ideonella sp.]|uniref:CHAT domain-containing protein n=1 Tax=Ideonella sp. TaxID=1929293 RepID=UPI002B4815F5|nr:CHAT domain-containing protein [Ideonella sp.]HJV67662.1 CHAT domain-containing protein [Ideonella sp.]